MTIAQAKEVVDYVFIKIGISLAVIIGVVLTLAVIGTVSRRDRK